MAANLQSVRQGAYRKAYFSNYFWFSDRVWFSVSSSRILSSSLQSVSYGPSQRRRWHSTKQWCWKMGIKTQLLTSQNWPLHEYLRKTVSKVKMQIKPRNFCLSCYFQGFFNMKTPTKTQYSQFCWKYTDPTTLNYWEKKLPFTETDSALIYISNREEQPYKPLQLFLKMYAFKNKSVLLIDIIHLEGS